MISAAFYEADNSNFVGAVFTGRIFIGFALASTKIQFE
jgi:hypothetical protein